MQKTNKVFKILFWAVLTGILVLAWYSGKNTDQPTAFAPQNVRLSDPNLLYASLTSSGLCGNEKGERGGCSSGLYVYANGKSVKETGFTNEKTMKKSTSSTEKQLDTSMISQVKKLLDDPLLSVENCPMREIMDAGWDYYFMMNDKQIWLRNPPEKCEAIFTKIDALIEHQ